MSEELEALVHAIRDRQLALEGPVSQLGVRFDYWLPTHTAELERLAGLIADQAAELERLRRQIAAFQSRLVTAEQRQKGEPGERGPRGFEGPRGRDGSDGEAGATVIREVKISG